MQRAAARRACALQIDLETCAPGFANARKWARFCAHNFRPLGAPRTKRVVRFQNRWSRASRRACLSSFRHV